MGAVSSGGFVDDDVDVDVDVDGDNETVVGSILTTRGVIRDRAGANFRDDDPVFLTDENFWLGRKREREGRKRSCSQVASTCLTFDNDTRPERPGRDQNTGGWHSPTGMPER